MYEERSWRECDGVICRMSVSGDEALDLLMLRVRRTHFETWF